MHKGLLALGSVLLIISGGNDLTVRSLAADNWFTETSFAALNIRSIGAFKLFSGLIALSFTGSNNKEIGKAIKSLSDKKTWKS